MLLSRNVVRKILSAWLIGVLALVPGVQANTSEQDFYEKALIFYQDAQYSDSLNAIKTALKIKPDHLPSRILYGEILLQFGEFAAAETQFKRALSFNADTSLVLPKLAQTLAVQNKYDEIVETILPVGNNDDVNFAILMYRGQALESLRRYDEALLEFNDAFKLKPKAVSVNLAKAGVAKKQNNLDLYQQQLARAETVAPDSPTVKFFKAEMARNAGDKQLALQTYSEILEVIPDFADVRRSRAAILIELDEVESAITDINYLLDAAPSDPFTRLLQAVALSKSDEGDRANVILDDIVGDLSVIDKETYETFAPIHFINGAAQFLLKKYGSAEKHLTKALEANPRGKNIRELLAEIAYKKDEQRKIVDILRPIPTNELSIRSAELLTSAWLAIEDFEQALTVLEALDTDVAKLPQFVKLRSAVLFKIGETEKAVATIEGSSLAAADEKAGLMLGYHALAVGDLKLANEVVNKLALVEDKSHVSYNFIGAVKLAEGDIADAENYFKQALSFAPSDVITQLNLSRTLIAKGQQSEAKQQIYQLAERHPDNLNVLRAKMDIDRRTQDLAAYRETLARLVALNPLAKELVIEYVNILLAQNRAAEAAPFVDRLRDEHTFWPPVLVAQAKVHIRLQNFEQAQRPLRVLFGLVEDEGQLVKLGELFIEARSMEFVEKTISRLDKLNHSSEAFVRLTSQYQFLNGDKADAIASLKQATAKSQNYQTIELLAQLLAQNGNLTEAIQYAKQAYQVSSNTQSVQMLANLYWQTDQANEAVKLMYAYLTDNQGNHIVRAALANMLHQMGQPKQAVSQYKLLLQAQPNSLFALINLGQLAAINGDFEQANDYAARALAVKSDDPIVLDLAGWVKVNLGQHNEGLKLLRDSFSRNASNPTNLYHLGVTLAQLQRGSEAKQMLEKSLQLGTTFNEEQAARSLLAELSNG